MSNGTITTGKLVLTDIQANSDGKFVFDRYNGTTWITKLDLT